MTKILTPIRILALISLATMAGCSSDTHKAGDAGTRSYDIKGKIVSIDHPKSAVMLDHEDIPGLMKAMTMDFHVEDPQSLKDLRPGDQVQGELVKTPDGYLIKRLRKR